VVTEISLITPPIGMNIFVLNSVAPDLSITTIYGGLAAFVVADLVRVVLLVFVPQISLFLPSLM
jgi:TRAP-type C4-dicarboxylate transport system permease large subunit